jgi:putative redox protein
MPNVSLDWEGGWRFAGYDSRQLPVDIDGEQRLGAKPSDLLPISLAACSGTDLVQLIGDRLTSLSVEASFTQQTEPPWAFQRIRLHYTITGADLTDAEVAEAIRKSEDEMCSVAASISVPIESSFTLSLG